MKRIVQILITFTLCVAAGGTGVAAPKKCGVIGGWTDKFGAEATFRTNKAGVASDVNLCAKPYRLTVTGLNEKHFNVSAASARASCPTFKASLIFEGSCSVASGTVAVTGRRIYHDTWTKSDAAVRHVPSASAALRDGLK